MRKIIALAFVAAAAVLGFKAYADSQGQSIGNPDSSNMLVVEEGYVVAVPGGDGATPQVPAPNSDSGVLLEGTNNNPANDVAASPQPNNPAQGAGTAAGNGVAAAGAADVSVNGNNNMPSAVTVDETVSGVVDGQGNGIYEVDETVTAN